jgi:N utilization substance protein B
MLRVETRRRARALQLLYAIDAGPDLGADAAWRGLARLTGPAPDVLDEARALADAVLGDLAALDRIAQAAADNWRLERIAAIERNILRLAIHELREGVTPPRVVIDEAIWLAQRFGGVRAPGFVNGVLDRVARDLGRL